MPAAVAAFFTEDAIFVTDTGPLYGPQAIEKSFADPVPEMACQQPYQKT